MEKNLKEIIKKRTFLFGFASRFLDGFLPEYHPYLINPLKRQRLRIYNGLSFFLLIMVILFLLIIGNINENIIFFLFYFLSITFFLIFNYFTRFKYFEFFLLFILITGIGMNIFNALSNNTFPPINYVSLLITVVVLHFIYNRWISLLYIIMIAIFIFSLIFIVNGLELNLEKIHFRIRYFYDFVFASLILWFVLEVYEHFREELELKLKQINDSRDKDLELAGEIQRQFYPIIPKNSFYYFDYLILPYDKVSGDYLDIIEKNNFYWIIIGDVTGHGLQSAMLTMQINTLLNYLIIEKDYNDIQTIFLELNNHYYKILNKLDIKNYATLTIGRLDKKGKIILVGSLSNIYHYNIEKKQWDIINEPSPLLGMHFFSTYDSFKILEFQLKPNEILFFCTDGLKEIFVNNQRIIDNNEFINILNHFIQQNANNTSKLIEFPSFLKNQFSYVTFNDDISALLIQYKVKEKHELLDQ